MQEPTAASASAVSTDGHRCPTTICTTWSKAIRPRISTTTTPPTARRYSSAPCAYSSATVDVTRLIGPWLSGLPSPPVRASPGKPGQALRSARLDGRAGAGDVRDRVDRVARAVHDGIDQR